MRAAVRQKYGPPESLLIKEIPVPKPGKGEVLIRVQATTVNRTDCAGLTGKPYAIRLFSGLLKPKKISTGTDFTGVVERVGEGVKDFMPGDRVFGFNDNGAGTHAQYVLFPVGNNIRHIPDSVSFENAAASLEGAHYALNFLNKVNVNSGDHILVIGGTGAIGSALVQILNHIGANVTAVCRAEHFERVKELGAHRVIDYMNDDFTRYPEKYNHVFDSVGKSSFGVCKKLMKHDGIYISSELGKNWENLFLALTATFRSGPNVIFPVPTNIGATLDYMYKLLEQGKFRPLIDKIITLEELPEAFRYTCSGQKVGNVVVRLWEG
jgi:NADPH:quinone reductase-like Zn-dependent oxidoreductase